MFTFIGVCLGITVDIGEKDLESCVCQSVTVHQYSFAKNTNKKQKCTYSSKLQALCKTLCTT